MKLSATLTSQVLGLNRRWHRVGHRQRRSVRIAAVALLVASWAFYQWWIVWPVRLTIRTSVAAFPLSFSHNGATLATMTPEAVVFRRTSDGQVQSTWKYTSPPLHQMLPVVWGSFSPDGQTFAAVSLLQEPAATFMINLIDVAKGQTRGTIPLGQKACYGLAFRPDGQSVRIVVGTPRQFSDVLDCDTNTGQIVSQRPLSIAIEQDPFRYALSPDGQQFAFTQSKHLPTGQVNVSPTSIVWDLDNDREVARLTERPESGGCYSVDLDGKTLAVTREDGTIDIWDWTRQRLLTVLAQPRGGFRSRDVLMTPQRSMLASVGVLDRNAFTLTSLHWRFDMFRRAPRCLRDDRPYELQIFDSDTGRCLKRWDSEGRPVFSPDGRTLATSAEDGKVIYLRAIPTR